MSNVFGQTLVWNELDQNQQTELLQRPALGDSQKLTSKHRQTANE